MRLRRGLTTLQLLLVGTVTAIAVVVAAYVFLPDVQRGLHAVIRDVAARLQG